MSRPVSCYRPSRRYYLLLLLALAGVGLSAWSGVRWPAAWLAAGGFGASALAVLALVLRPAVEIHETHLKLGRRSIAWRDIRRLDRTAWNVPLVLRLTLIAKPGSGKSGPERLTLIYPGDLDGCRSLLRHLRRYSREALLDGVPYPKFWGEAASQTGPSPAGQPRQLPPGQGPLKQIPPARYPLLRPDDEEEVERMFQRLKAEGTLEQPGPIGQQRGEPRGPDEQ
ncbi:MAG TPA: hypothetical protein VN841_07465 [Bryobacteraceae bacterium]|nr:hypothetical protein [Bryobacteraceae bacterium]